MLDWYTKPIAGHCPKGGEELFDRPYRGGEWLPFYVPRAFMPQVDEASYPRLQDFAAARGVCFAHDVVKPDQVRPHQRVTISHVIEMDEATLAKPILVSRDGYILDGNHRWYKHNQIGSSLNVIRFDLDFEDAIGFLFSFPLTYYYGDGNVHPISS